MVAQFITKLQNTNKMTTNNETPKNNFNATIGNTVLCDGFLIPMTDFVNNVGNMENYPSHENALSWIYNYATLLKQPLKLEMFVPLDYKGRICHEVIIDDEDDLNSERFKKHYETENKEFENACLKMLFEPNFEVKSSDYNVIILLDTTLVIGQLQEKQDRFILSRFRNGETIEDLIGFVKLKLSQTALNAIFG